MKTIFKVGDRVRYGDFEGVLVDNGKSTYALRLEAGGWSVSFTPEGKDNVRGPILLTLIEAAKVKTVRRFYVWAEEDGKRLYQLNEMFDEDFRDIKGRTNTQNGEYAYHKTNTYVDIEVEW